MKAFKVPVTVSTKAKTIQTSYENTRDPKAPGKCRKEKILKYCVALSPVCDSLYWRKEERGRRATRKAKTPTGFTRTFPEVAEATAARRNKVPQWHIRLQATQTQHAVPMCE